MQSKKRAEIAKFANLARYKGMEKLKTAEKTC